MKERGALGRSAFHGEQVVPQMLCISVTQMPSQVPLQQYASTSQTDMTQGEHL